jgi:hypothetical protein
MRISGGQTRLRFVCGSSSGFDATDFNNQLSVADLNYRLRAKRAESQCKIQDSNLSQLPSALFVI